LEQEKEFLSAEAAAAVVVARVLLQARRRRPEDLVAHRMAQLVVDLLEMVEVQEQNGKWFVPFDGVPKNGEESGAIGKVGERIERCLSLEVVAFASDAGEGVAVAPPQDPASVNALTLEPWARQSGDAGARASARED
jgi:hypothetical protein